ncbi:MAG: TIGR02147 family protein [Oligoflexus sp.]
MDIFQFNDYRDILKNELSRRTKQNPSYSQGALARDLGLAPSRLSEILNGKQGMSVKVAMKIAKGLRLSAEEQEFFSTLVECQHGRSRLARETATLRLEKFRHLRRFEPLQSEFFKALSSWYHLAIIELQKLSECKWDASWIARQLGIEAQEAEEAMKRLSRLGLISQGESSQLAQPPAAILNGVSGAMTTECNKSLHRGFLEKVRELVGKNDPKQSNYSFAVAIDSSKLDQILPLVNATLEQLLFQIAEQTPVKDQLYLFAANFVPCNPPLLPTSN